MDSLAKTRAKRLFFLVLLLGIIFGSLRFLPRVSAEIQGKLPDGKQFLSKVTGLIKLPIPTKDKEERTGEVAGVKEEISQMSQELIQNKVEQVIKTIKELPQEEAKRVEKEIKKQICNELLKEE